MAPLTLAAGFVAGVAAAIAAAVILFISEARAQERALYGSRDDRYGFGGTAWTGKGQLAAEPSITEQLVANQRQMAALALGGPDVLQAVIDAVGKGRQ